MLAVTRTRTNTQRIEVLEGQMEKLNSLPTEIATLRASVEARLVAESAAFKRNDDDHREIKRSLLSTHEEMKQLRSELLN